MANKWFIIKFIQLLAPVASVLFIAVVFYGKSEISREVSQIKSIEFQNVELGAGALNYELESIAQDITFLSNHTALLITINTPSASNLFHLAEDFVNFSASKKIYNQIRWLDETGMERSRIDFQQGNSIIITDDKLQNKANRYYFNDAFILNRGEIFVSPLDLNIEQGKVEKPYKPMIRVGTPVFNEQGQKSGIILLNYFGADLLQRFAQATLNVQDHISILNKSGYWLKSPNREQEWGFMFNQQDLTLGNYHPQEWQLILKQDSGQELINGTLWTWKTVYPLSLTKKNNDSADSQSGLVNDEANAETYVWKVVAKLPVETLAIVKGSIWKQLAWIYSLVVFLMGIGSWKLAQAWEAQVVVETEIKQINAELELIVEQRTAQLKGKVVELDKALQELAHKNTDMENMIYIASHDLRSPLINIQGFSQRLGKAINTINERFKEDDVPDTVKTSLEKIMQERIPRAIDFIMTSSLKMDTLINGLLMLSRAGRVPLHIEPLDINKMMGQIIASLSIQLQKVGSKVVFKNLHPCVGDLTQLNHIFLNIIDNAIKYHEPSRPLEINISSEQMNGYIRYKITDNGIGIKSEQQPKIWQLFYRLDPSGPIKGEGIGLTLVSRIITRLEGSIQLDSVWGEGSCFTIELPAVEEKI